MQPNNFLTSQGMAKRCLIVVNFMLHFWFLEGQVRNNCTDKQPRNEKCSLRYDLTKGIAKQYFEGQNCEHWYSNQYCICDSQLKIWYFNVPPYMFSSSNGTVGGIIIELFNIAMESCCNKCTRLVYLKPFESVMEVATQFYNKSYYSILMPGLGVSDATTYFGFPYVRLMKTPGVTYIHIDKTSEMIMAKLLGSLQETWPLSVLILLLTMQGGVIIWLLDTKKNNEEFPTPFIRGSMEGSWWAFVSMTTVGYGDKSPKSFFARIFAILWISIGISFSGIFTASMSSALTSAALGEKTKLHRHKVGFLKQIALGYEENIIYREGGVPIGHWNVSELITLLKEEAIEGILMDSLVFRYHWKQFRDSGLQLGIKRDVENSNTGVGLSFSGEEYNEWVTFLRSFFKENEDAESRLLADAINIMDLKLPEEQRETITSGGSPFGSPKMYRPALVTMAICCVTMIAAGLIVECLRKLYNRGKGKKRVVEGIEMSLSKRKKDSKILERNIDEFAEIMENSVLTNIRTNVEAFKSDIVNNTKNQTT